MAHFSIQKKRDQYRKQGIFHTNKDLAQKVKERLEQYTDQPITEIVDLCVGGGGLLEPFSDDVAKFGCDIESEFVEYTQEINRHDILAQGDSYCLSVSTLAMKPVEQDTRTEAEIELEFNANERKALESDLKNISTTIKMYKLMSSLDIRQTAYYKEYLERANAIITEALKDLGEWQSQ